ncbi:MAG TPA: adenylate kinase [Acidobacteriota bacterium]|nr:adenylate kinase [Acidobacteriota bacterium]
MTKPIPVIIFLGAPGVGKGTQASLLSQRKGIPKISTGDMLRHAVDDDSELGRKVKEIMNDGGLVDDQTMLSLVKERIRRSDCQNGFILDGYPRNLAQAAALNEALEPHMRVRVFELAVSDEDILKRIAGRRTCPRCERIYNVHYQPPQKDELCDFDGTALVLRNDDNERVVRKRLQTYKKETFPLIDHYRKLGLLNLVNGFQPKETLAGQISELL